MLVILLILWLVSPIALTIFCIVDRKKISKQKSVIKELSEENARLKGMYSSSEAAEQAEKILSEEKETEQSAESRYDTSYMGKAAKPAAPVWGKPADVPPKAERRRKISSINVMLILGAMFIIIAGLIFATTAWEFLSSGVKAVVIFSFSAIFFGVSSLSERKFGLKKTGVIFYTLGSVFLPITLVAAGYFRVFGEWFSLFGEGRPLLLALTFALLSAVGLKGSADYKSAPFAWVNLAGFSAAVCSLILQFTDRMDIFAAAASIYGLVVILICRPLSNKTSEKFGAVISQLGVFAAVNTVLLSISTFISAADKGNGIMVCITSVIFAVGFLKLADIPLGDENGLGAAIPFVIFVTCGMLSLFSPDDFVGVVQTAVAAAAVPVALSMLGIFPIKIKSALRAVSGVFASALLALCIIAALVAEPTWISLAAYCILAAEMLVLGIFHREESNGKIMISTFPAACVTAAIVLSRLIFKSADIADRTFYTALTVIPLIAVMQAVFVFVKPLKLRTDSSDYIFAAGSLICGSVALGIWGEDKSSALYMLLGFAVSALTVILPIIGGAGKIKRILLASSAMAWGGLLAEILNVFFHNPVYPMTITSLVLSAAALALTFLRPKDDMEIASVICLRAVTAVYILIGFVNYETVFPLFLILTALCLVRFWRKKRISELVGGIILSSFSVGAIAYDAFGADIYDAVLAAGAAAAVINAAMLFIGGGGKFAKIAERTSRYTLFAAASITMLVLASTGAFDAVYISAAALLFLYMTVSFYCAESTAALILPFSLLYPTVLNLLENRLFDGYYSYGVEGYYPDFNIINVTICVMLAVSIGLSYALHRNALREKSRNSFYIDGLAFSRIIGLMSYFDACPYNGDKSRWFGIFPAAACLMSFCRKNQRPDFRRWIYTVSAAAPFTAFMVQPFVEFKEIIALEMQILPILLYLFAIRFLWKNRTGVIDIITFAAYVVSYIVLFFSALVSGELADGLIIMITALAMLIFSFSVKKKKWFVLAVTVLVTTALFMSRGFWASLGWWVYLLAAGLLLIAIGSLNEMKKQSADKEGGFRKKLTRFMSEWTW